MWLLLFSTALVVNAQKNTKDLPVQFCEAFVQCSAVTLLEERLCLGNSVLRPYWLPSPHDSNNCHEKLRNDYTKLDKMEEQLESLLLECLLKHTVPYTAEQKSQCHSRAIRSAPRFSYERSINYVPTQCFTGVERRRNRECGLVRSCCPAISRCSTIPTQSQLAKSIDETRVKLRKRAKDCEQGLRIEKIDPSIGSFARSSENSDEPSGHITVNFDTLDSKKKADDESKSDLGKVKVNFTNGGRDGAFSQGEAGVVKTSTKIVVNEAVGQVSAPVRSENFEKVNFPQNSNSASELREEDGSLTISGKPQLSFPSDNNDKMAFATRAGVVVVNIHEKEPNRPVQWPRSNKSHDELFEHAMKNTNEYKAKIREADLGKVARTGLESLVNAGQASAGGPYFSGKGSDTAKRPMKASGRMHRIEMTDDQSDEDVHGEFVTSPPVIFVKKEDSVKNQVENCSIPSMKGQTKKLQVILSLLGEKKDSSDMKEIKELINEWRENFRTTSKKEDEKKKEIAKALEDLIKRFDRVNLEVVKKAVLLDLDSLDEDEETTKIPCENILVRLNDELPDGKTKHNIEKVQHGVPTEVRDHVIVEDGVEKLLLNEGDSAADSNVDAGSSKVVVDEKPLATDEKGESHEWSNEEYKRELNKYKKKHHINSTNEPRNETSCDLYMRCRNQMHLAVDSCAWRFASGKVLPTLAESAESLLYKGEELCDPSQQPRYEELYEMVIKRNAGLRSCLDKKNAAFFESSICVPYSTADHIRFNSAFLRLLGDDYKHSSQCFRDANLIQEKCTKLRECCPNFDDCRQSTMDVHLEQAIISKTAQLNEDKQKCLKRRAREAFKMTLRGLLGKGGWQMLQKLKRGELDMDIDRGAQAIARL